MKLRHLLLERKAITNLDSLLKSRDITLPAKVYNQSCGFSRSHVWIWELDRKEGWAPKNWCFRTVLLEKALESPLDSREIQVNPKGNKPWIFIGRTDAEAEAPILWPPDAKSWLLGKDPDAGIDWGQEEKGVTEDEMVYGHSKSGLCLWEPWDFARLQCLQAEKLSDFLREIWNLQAMRRETGFILGKAETAHWGQNLNKWWIVVLGIYRMKLDTQVGIRLFGRQIYCTNLELNWAEGR